MDPSLQAHMECILHTIMLIHSVINFKIHTHARLSKCGELGISQVVSSKDLTHSDILFDSISYQ